MDYGLMILNVKWYIYIQIDSLKNINIFINEWKDYELIKKELLEVRGFEALISFKPK